ncbi:MAG: starch-binding protein [Lachnospiraceae bacterium]|nr:starch-binding protein [Lachnospiraceae bacterium]
MKLNMRLKRIFSMFLVLLMVCSVITISPKTVQVVEASSTTKDYGLCDDIQDGVILHCFNWKYNDIKAELENIAEAGFTSVQTSPAQVGAGSGVWWWLYQPLGFYVGTNALGTKAELKSLCEEAEKYGIKVIVDVVANHLAGDHSNIQSDLKDSKYWHDYSGSVDWSNRWQVTHGSIGMPDINSESSYVQKVVKNYLSELESLGVDGIRWDAAKHIGLPSEGCDFWSTVTSGSDLYHYGEILKGPDDRESGNESLMKEYTKYMTVTDSDYGKTLRDAFNSGSVPSAYANWAARGVSASKLIYWAESHDTWSNNQDWGYSNGMSQNVIDRAYAIAASRKNITALYFSRPSSKVKDNIKAGQKGSTHFKSDEVAEVNKFHNAMIGQDDYYVHENNVAAVCREEGVVVALGSGSNKEVSIKNGGSTTKPGTYVDQLTGNKWTVTSSTISGKVGSTGIAVIYNPEEAVPTPTISKEGGSFSTDTLTLTLGLENATSGTYQIGSSSAKTYTSSKSITIGSDMAVGDSVKITLTATDGTNTTTKTYTFKRVEKSTNVAYLKLPSGWGSTVYCYAYDDVTGTKNATWPGVEMTYDSATGNYMYEIPEDITTPRVIFYNSSSNRYPGSSEKGLLCEGTWIYNGSTWKEYDPDNPYSFAVYDNGIYFENTEDWSKVNVYYWSSSNTHMTTWPGEAMTEVEDGIYGYEFDEDCTAKYIIFNNGSDQTENLTLTMNGMYDVDGLKYVIELKGKVTVKYVDESGKEIAAAKTMTGTVGNSYTTSAATIDGYTLKATPLNASGTYTKADIIVTYVYAKDTEPLSATLTIGGSTAGFAKEVGSSVTLDVSASGGSGDYTYTYKAYNGSNWITLKNASTSSSYTDTLLTAGYKRYVVVVKDSTGTAVDSNKITAAVTEVASLSGTLTANGSASNQTVSVGNSVTLKASATGGSGSYTYTYKAYNGSGWVTLKSATTSSSYTDTLSSVGYKRYVVVVKDSTGTTVDTNKITVTAKESAALAGTLKINGSTSNRTVEVGTSLTLNVTATGGSGSYTYTYKVYNGSKWITLKSATEATSYTTVVTSAGSMRYVVVVKDSSGTTVDTNKITITFN